MEELSTRSGLTNAAIEGPNSNSIAVTRMADNQRELLQQTRARFARSLKDYSESNRMWTNAECTALRCTALQLHCTLS